MTIQKSTIKKLSTTHDVLLKILNVLQLNNKIINFKLNYKKNTDYIDSIYFKDYRNKCFVLSKEYYYLDYNLGKFKLDNPDVFCDLIDENTFFIDLRGLGLFYSQIYPFYINETTDTYELKNISYYRNEFIKYKFNKYIKQENINISYCRIDNSFKFLPRYNFVNITSELKELIEKIDESIDNIRSNFIDTDYFIKVYKEDEILEITDNEINKKLEQLLFPITYLSNKCDFDTLSIKLNKDFTKDKLGKTRGWLIKDFIEVLERLGAIEINNIE